MKVWKMVLWEMGIGEGEVRGFFGGFLGGIGVLFSLF